MKIFPMPVARDAGPAGGRFCNKASLRHPAVGLIGFAAICASVCFSATPAAPALPPCCAVEEKAGAPLSGRSIYQLDANWTDDAGATVRLAALRGRPVVLAMFFAQCEYACPILVQDMQRLRALLPEAVRAQAQFVLQRHPTLRTLPHKAL